MKKDKFYDIWTIIVFILCFGSAFMAVFACENVATAKEIREICNFGIMALLGITAFSFSIGLNPNNQKESINIYRKYAKAMLVCISIFIFFYIATYVPWIMGEDIARKIITWIILVSISATLIYNIILVLVYVHYNFRDKSEQIHNINESKNVANNDLQKLDVVNNINYNRLIIKLMSDKIWGINIRSIVAVNITTDIIKHIEDIVKQECPEKDDKDMFIAMLDGYIDSFNTLGAYNVLFITILSSFTIELIIKFFEITFTISNRCFRSFMIVVIIAAIFYTRDQKKKTKCNIIRKVTQKLLDEKVKEQEQKQ